MTTGDNQLNSWTKWKLQSTSQCQNCIKKKSCSLFGGLLLVWLSHCSFLNWQNHYICETCSANYWDTLKTAMPAASIGQQKGPNSSPQWHRPQVTQRTLQKLVNRAMKFGFICCIHLMFSHWTHFFKHLHNFFAGKMLPQPAGVRKRFPRVLKIQNHGFLCYRNKQTYSCWQKCGDCNGSYFD